MIYLSTVKMKKRIYLFCILAFWGSKSQAQTVADYDGNVYHTVTIGTQVWTKENLNVKHYRNGDPITEVKDSVAWVNQKTGAWCYNENKPSNGPVYGTLSIGMLQMIHAKLHQLDGIYQLMKNGKH